MCACCVYNGVHVRARDSALVSIAAFPRMFSHCVWTGIRPRAMAEYPSGWVGIG